MAKSILLLFIALPCNAMNIGGSGTDNTRVLKAGDTMTGPLTIVDQASGDIYTLAVTTDNSRSSYDVYVDTSGNVMMGAKSLSGPRQAFLWIPAQAAIQGGLVTGDRWDPVNTGGASFNFGQDNRASGISAVALGGDGNNAIGDGAITIGGSAAIAPTDWGGYVEGALGTCISCFGSTITVNGLASVVIGAFNTSDNVLELVIGELTTASGQFSVVTGFGNTNDGDSAAIIGGSGNDIDQHATNSAVIAGGANQILGGSGDATLSAIIGGGNNTIRNIKSGIVTSNLSEIDSPYSFIGGGYTDFIHNSDAPGSAIIGGSYNNVYGYTGSNGNNVIIGGANGISSGTASAVIAGVGNNSYANYTLTVGQNNSAYGVGAIVTGNNSTSTAQGDLIMTDSIGAVVVNTTDTFVAKFQGGTQMRTSSFTVLTPSSATVFSVDSSSMNVLVRSNFALSVATQAAGAAGALVSVSCPANKWAMTGGCSCTGTAIGVETADVNMPFPTITVAGGMPTGWQCQKNDATAGLACAAFVICSKISF